MRIVQVAVPVPTLELLTYRVPEALDLPRPGCRVLVPVGPRTLTGCVVEASKASEASEGEAGVDGQPAQEPVAGLRDILDALDTEPFLPPPIVALALWVSDYYTAAPGEAIAAAMPPFAWIESRRLIQLTDHGREAEQGAAARDQAQALVLQALDDGRPRSVRQLAAAVGRLRGEPDAAGRATPIQAVVAALERRGLVASAQVVRGSADAHKTVTRATLTAEGQDVASSPEATVVGSRQREALVLLSGAPGGLVITSLRERGVTPDTLRRLARRGLLTLRRERVERDPFRREEAAWRDRDLLAGEGQERALSGEQAAALERLAALADTGTFHAALLHGVTGSGKTEVYLRLASRVCGRERRVLVLVPEIALTPALAAVFRGAFGDRVAVLHSGLADGERHDQWQRIRRGEIDIVVGTRSAVFAPLAGVGLIIVDEEHDGSYKQEEAPRYNGRDVAVMRGKRENALVVLGSATPAVETFQNAVSGRYTLLALERRVLDRPLAAVRLVDMRDEYAVRGPDAIFSEPLREAIEARLARSEQVLVLLNRRGFATAVFCRQCGGTIDCPNCSVSLTVHGTGSARRARCHYCNHASAVPATCPQCAAPYLEQVGVGTERIESEAARLFPGVRLARLDRDVLRRRGAAVALLNRFGRGEIDILVGTQMIAKGHDFPAVTLVGVISADVGLGLPDFRAAERTFQLLTQVVGRAGRGERLGEAIIQTIHPGHYSVRHACRQDYRAFFDEEMRYRRALRYPPAVALVNVLVRGAALGQAMEWAADLAGAVRAVAPKGREMRVIGPAPAALTRLKGETRVQFFLKSPSRGDMREALRAALRSRPHLRRRVTIDVDPLSVL